MLLFVPFKASSFPPLSVAGLEKPGLGSSWKAKAHSSFFFHWKTDCSLVLAQWVLVQGHGRCCFSFPPLFLSFPRSFRAKVAWQVIHGEMGNGAFSPPLLANRVDERGGEGGEEMPPLFPLFFLLALIENLLIFFLLIWTFALALQNNAGMFPFFFSPFSWWT